jgi:two-component system response regulator HydG
MKERILIVDDDQDQCDLLGAVVGRLDYAVTTTTSPTEALSLAASSPFDAILTDLGMSTMSGTELCSRIMASRPDVPVIVVTGLGSLESAIAAMRAGAYDFLNKPVDVNVLGMTLQRAVQHRLLREEVKRLREQVPDPRVAGSMIGESGAMKGVVDLITRVGPTEASVLIHGETGTGKELVARAVHAAGPRGSGPFVAINCAAVPASLLESELFGHARGAFTGASQARRGLFVEADEGTLFLDEVGDLPLPLQGKLLRVLQSGEVRPVGSESSRTVDVRCIAATHKDLGALVERGLFREDLFFRLDVLRLPVPPLRQRPDDIPTLVDHFLGRSRTGASRSVLVGFEPDALDFLTACDWPGNVRQLENVVERLVVTAGTPRARLADVQSALGPARDSDPIGPLLRRPLTLDELERRYIAGILDRVGGSKVKAAEILGVDPSTLYRREKPRR